MADITNQQAVKFCNEKARKYANHMIAEYYFAKASFAEWFAQGIDAVTPNDSSPIIDGAATDGRPLATGAKVNNIVTRMSDLITDLEANSSAKLNTLIALSNRTDWPGL